MGWDADDERRVARALVNARDALTSIKREPVGADIVFTAFCWALDVERRQKVRDVGPRPLKAMKMEYVRTKEEHAEDFKQRMVEISMGDSPDEVFGIYAQPSPVEIDTMESVNKVFRGCLVGRNEDRDWRILHLMARPKATARQVSKAIGRSAALVADRKVLQCQAIWKQLNYLAPETRTGSGVVWGNAA